MDPEGLPLSAWLDAGYVMLVEGADATARELLDELFAAEDDEAMDRGFVALRDEMEARRAESDKAEAEQRRQAGRPPRVRMVAPGTVEATADEWASLITEAQQARDGERESG